MNAPNNIIQIVIFTVRATDMIKVNITLTMEDAATKN